MTSISTIDYSIRNLNAPELCSYLIRNELQDMYRQIPDQWVAQAMAGAVYFSINHEDIELNLVRVQLHSMSHNGKSIKGKFRISAVLNKKTGELCEWTDSPRGYQEFINFNSPMVTLAASLFSKADYKLLQSYAAWWESQTVNMFTSPMCNRRLWITPRNTQFSLKFQMEVRLNPNTGANVLGLGTNIVLKAPSFLDTVHSKNDDAPIVTATQSERSGSRTVAVASELTLPKR